MVYTRITDKTTQDSMLQSLLVNRNKLTDLQEQVSSGVKVSTPSDDSSSVVAIMNCTNTLNNIKTYTSNISSASSELSVTNSAISSLVDVITRAKELTVQASSATTDSDGLSAISSEMSQLLDQVTDLANTQYNGKYVFGGLVTQTTPYTTDSSGNIEYQGTPSTGNYEREVQISDGVTTAVNVSGDQLFGQYSYDASTSSYTGSGIIKTLSTLIKDLNTDPADYTAISSHLDEIDSNLSSVTSIQSKLGAVSSKLDMTSSKLADDKITYTTMKSSLQDIDVAQAVSDLTYQETSLQASLKVTASISQLSLLDYI